MAVEEVHVDGAKLGTAFLGQESHEVLSWKPRSFAFLSALLRADTLSACAIWVSLEGAAWRIFSFL